MARNNTYEAEGVHPIVSENIRWVTPMRRCLDKQATTYTETNIIGLPMVTLRCRMPTGREGTFQKRECMSAYEWGRRNGRRPH